MSIVIPDQISNETQSYAEKSAYSIFTKEFDDTWTIFHSLALQGENLDTKLIDAEADFVFLHKDYGMLVLEVKGGVIEFDGKGSCFQNGKKISDPAFQAKINKYNLERLLKRRLSGDPKIRLGHCVYFPDTYQAVSTFPPHYEQVTFTANDTPYIKEAIINLFDRIKNPRNEPIPDGLASAIVNALSPKISLGNTIFDKISANKKIFDTVSEVQSQLLEFISRYKHAFIEGCGGSGKTILAVKKARQLAIDGKKVLLLCYNIPLGKNLKEYVADFKNNIYAGNYHDFCIETLSDSKYKDQLDFADKNFWLTRLPELMQKYIAENSLKYDAIIIDEAQDFRDSYWLSLCDMFQEDKIFYLFYDPGQNIFATDMSFPVKLIPFTLNKVCRNTGSIFQYMKSYTDIPCELYEDMPDGIPVEEFSSSNINERSRILGRILKKLLHEDKINPDSIVILGGHAFSHTTLNHCCKFGDIVVRDCSEELPEEKATSNEKHVRYYTYMRFKGCEADAVILLDVNENDPRWNKTGMYTAVSRAKNLLYIIKKQ